MEEQHSGCWWSSGGGVCGAGGGVGVGEVWGVKYQR